MKFGQHHGGCAYAGKRRLSHAFHGAYGGSFQPFNNIFFIHYPPHICVEVPVEFGAVATVGDTYVACNGASADEICPDCALNDATTVDPLPSTEDTADVPEVNL